MRRRNDKGFTLIELMVVITILGILASLASVAVLRYLKEARIDTSKSQMRTLVDAIDQFRIRKGRLPEALSELVSADPDESFIANATEVPRDSWGGEFQYNRKDKRSYDLVCLGGDGAEGGEGEDADFSKEDLFKAPSDKEK